MLKVLCMYLHYINSKGKDQPGKVANPARGQLNREKVFLPCPRSHLRTWSRDTGSAVPYLVRLLISTLRLNLVLTCGIPPEFRCGLHEVLMLLLKRRSPLISEEMLKQSVIIVKYCSAQVSTRKTKTGFESTWFLELTTMPCRPQRNDGSLYVLRRSLDFGRCSVEAKILPYKLPGPNPQSASSYYRE